MTSPIISEPLTNREADRTLWIMIAVLFTLALIVRLACFTGLIASDDFGYAKYAQQISQGNYHLEPHHFAIRYGVIVPLAAVYRLFGIHEWTTIILPLISSSLAPALIAALAARLSGGQVAWIAGLLLATFPVDIRYASVLVAEPSHSWGR
jgi:4-amino-4-deoxy-L-arabinose transferase-like glycosyltransferase